VADLKRGGELVEEGLEAVRELLVD